jgi:hypothetical protein
MFYMVFQSTYTYKYKYMEVLGIVYPASVIAASLIRTMVIHIKSH